MAGGSPAPAAVIQVRPLDGRGRWLRIGPFLAVALTGLVGALLDPDISRRLVALDTAVLGLIVLAVAALPWRRWPAGWHALPAMGLFVVSGILGYAAAENNEFLFIATLPAVWLALFHTRRLLIVGLVLLALVLLYPPVLLEIARPEWTAAVLTLVMTIFATLLGHYVVARSRYATAAAQAATRQAHADRDLLNAYLDNAGSLVVVLDREGRVSLFNRVAEELSGYREEDLLGQTLWSQGRDPEGVQQAFREALATGGPVRYTGVWIIRSGEQRRVAWTGSGMRDDAGEVTHVICTGTDITEKLNTQRLFTNVLGAATEHMIAATDPHGVFTVFNAGAERLLGYRAEEVIGKLTTEAIHVPAELQALAESVGAPSFREMLALPDLEQNVVDTNEWTLVRKDGSHVPVSMAVHTMRDEGQPVGYVLTARDVTAERAAKIATVEALEREHQAAERLRELDQVKSDFVATVSHDLRTPLTSIIGNTELLLDGDAGEVAPMQRRLLEAVDRNARRLDTLVGDLLMLSRIEAGTLRMNTRDVSLNQVVDGALEALTAQRAGDVEMVVDVPPQPVLIRGDLDQLERVTTNLISNALKFTPPGGRVEIRLGIRGDQAELSVADTGIGIPEDELAHVFDRFYRSSRSQQKKSPGTGLGLTIAKSIVEQHGGTIRAGANPGGGTVFSIALPLLSATAEAEKEPA